LYLLLGALVTFGAMLGFYVPFIPFVVFTVTVLGWFIAVIEAMAAAPIIALGILSPGGQSEMFGKAEPSLLILLNLFLRPSLIVIGLIAGIFLVNVAISIVNLGFQTIMQSVFIGIGVLEQALLISIYISLLVTVVNKAFTIIHVLPERILTYIGGQAIQYGEAEASGALKQALVAGAAGAAVGGLKGAADASGQGGLSIAKARQQKAKGGPGQDVGLGNKDEAGGAGAGAGGGANAGEGDRDPMGRPRR